VPSGVVVAACHTESGKFSNVAKMLSGTRYGVGAAKIEKLLRIKVIVTIKRINIYLSPK
jgi:hypothetical protein